MLDILAARYAYKAYYEQDYHFPKTDTQVLIRRVRRNAVVSYRGSDRPLDWLANFSFTSTNVTPYRWKGTARKIKVHRGMIAAYQSSREVLLDIIASIDCDRYLFTGHSLGGVLAAFAALDCQYNLGVDPIVRTFGAPDFGNKHFQESYNHRVPNTLGFINPYDIVPELPMHLLGYKPIGSTVKVKRPWMFIDKFPFFDPHYMGEYLIRSS